MKGRVMTLPLADSTIQAVQATVIASIGKHGYHTPLNKHMHPGIKLMILVEEVGEVAKELLEHPPTTNSNSDALVKELLQVAGVALSWAQCADEGGL